MNKVFNSPIYFFICVDPPPLALRRGLSCPGFSVILPDLDPSEQDDILVAILVKEPLVFSRKTSLSNRLVSLHVLIDGRETVFLACYLRPRDVLGLEDVRSHYRVLIRQGVRDVVICGDMNGKSHLWGPTETESDNTGRILVQWFEEDDLIAVNQYPCLETFSNTRGVRSWIDLTVVSETILRNVSNWRVEKRHLVSLIITTSSLTLGGKRNPQLTDKVAKLETL